MVGIFDEGALPVDTADLEKDLPELAQTRVLYQFQNSQVLNALVRSLANQNQDLYDTVLGVLRGVQLANAVGDALDIIGRIVGQPRILLNAAEKAWFTPDDTLGTVDGAPAWVTGAPLFGDLPADDFEFRRLIVSKIFKNQVKGSTMPELLTFAKFLTGRNVSFVRTGPKQLGVVVPADMPYNDVLNLLRVTDDKTADRKYLLPVSATTEINFLQWRPEPPFAPDRAGSQPDLAKAAINTEVF